MMIVNAKMLFDDDPNSLASPTFTFKAVMKGSKAKKVRDLRFLLERKFGRRTGSFCGKESLHTRFTSSFAPLTHSTFSYPQRLCYFRLRPTHILEFPCP